MCSHVGAKLPRDDVTAVIVENCAEIDSNQSDELKIGEYGLPELVNCGSFVCELVCALDHNAGWACNLFRCLEDPIG